MGKHLRIKANSKGSIRASRNQKAALLCLLLLVLFTPQLTAQSITVTGTIVSVDGSETLPGVNVVEKGTTKGTVTNAGGKYSILVPEGAVLVFSSIGYESQEKVVGNQSVIDISLAPDIRQLQEVVVIGYGTVLKRDLTGSVVSVKSEEIRQIPAQNPLESVQGKVAGVDITRSNGSSSSGVNITIRGNRSIGAGNSPLFIVDGIQTSSLANINPNDIESMEFLKDASSTAIYGWQGANGIVIVTTKKGSSGQPKVSFSSYYGVSDVARYPSVMNGTQYADLKREANRTTGDWNSVEDDASIFNPAELDAVNNNEWIDYQDLLFKKGTQQNYNVGVDAGGDKTKVYFSLDYFREKGILQFDDTKRYSIRANVDQTFNRWIKAGLQSQVTTRDESYRRDPLNMANKIIPLGTVYDDAGDFILFPLNGSSISPLADEQPNVFSNTGKKTNVIANLYLELKPFSGFSFRTNFGSNIGNSRVGNFEGAESISRTLSGTSQASINSSNSRFINWDNVITYKKEINDHSFTITALSSYVEDVSDDVTALGQDQLLPGQLYYALGNAPEGITINSSYTKWNVLSFAGRLNYSYKGKYLVTLTSRTDGASILSTGNKWASFPSAAFAWRVIDEGFMSEVGALSELKLRLSYGVAGNSGIPPYGTQSSLTRVPMAFGEASFQGFTFSPLLGNTDTGWELSKTKNLGLDIGLWGDRVSATLDIYDTRTSDLLLPRGLPPTTGVQQVYQNVGKTRNRGVEVSLSSANIKTDDLSWTSALTFSANKEEIVTLVTEGVDDIGNGWFVGHPTEVFYDFEKLGIWQSGEADEATAFGQVPGDIKVKDQDGDGAIDAVNDRKVLASTRPKWFGGFNNKVTYKGFDLGVYVFVRWGQTINPNFLRRYDRQSHLNNSATIINYWTPENPSNDYPRPNANVSLSSTLYNSTLGYVDGSYVKIRNLSLGYTFPEFKTSVFKNLRVYATGTNLFILTKDDKLNEYDPERGGGESAPMLKTYVFGFTVGF